MAPYRKTLPSFTLVLTSGHHSLRPATIQLSPATLPTAPDFLMKTIDLRHDSTDNESVEDRDEPEDVDSQTFDHVAEQTSTNSVKHNLLSLVRKLVSHKWKLGNRPIVSLKPSPN